MNNVKIASNRKTVQIVKSFTNGFAQQVYELADGSVITINYSQTEVTFIAPSE